MCRTKNIGIGAANRLLDRAIRVALTQRAPTALIIPSDVQELPYSAPTHAFKMVWGGYYEPGTDLAQPVDRLRRHRGMPSGAGLSRGPRVVLLRRLMGCRGTARIPVLLQPRAAFGTHGPGQLSLAQ